MREKELRLALVCFGGISLAVYMHGISKEILEARSGLADLARDRGPPAARVGAASRTRLRRAIPSTTPRRSISQLLQAIGRRVELRVIVDVIAGASAGGINGVMLGRALAHDLRIGHLRDMWLDGGDVSELLARSGRARAWSKLFMNPLIWLLGWSGRSRSVRNPEVRRKLSLFVRSRWFKPPFDGPRMCELMFDAVDRMGEPADPDASLMPGGQQLEMFVTLTDFYGYQQLIQIHDPALIREREHRHVLRFSYRRFPNGEVQSDFGRDNAAGLAFAARATSSYPGAFPPAQIREIDRLIAARGGEWPQRAAFLQSNFLRYYRAGLDPLATSFIDGSVLNNKPFAEALAAIRDRPAYRQVDRRLVYIDPDPVQPRLRRAAELPGFFTTLKGALSDLPRNEPISDELAFIAGANDRVRRLRAIVDSARPQIARLVTALANRPWMARSAWRRSTHGAKPPTPVAQDAGFAYQGYVRLKLDSVRSYVARVIASICGLRELSPQAQAVDAIVEAWAQRRGIVLQRGGAMAPGQGCRRLRVCASGLGSGSLLAFDVEFRSSGAWCFSIQGQNRLYATLGEAGPGADPTSRIDALKRDFYQCLDRLRRYEKPRFYSAATRRGTCGHCSAPPLLTAEQAGSIETHARAFAAANEAALTGLIGRLAVEIDLDAATHDVDALLARPGARAMAPAGAA